MSDKSIGKTSEPSPPLFNEGVISSKVISIDWAN
jgi:hypothetical protein